MMMRVVGVVVVAIAVLCASSCASVAPVAYVAPSPTETLAERTERYLAWHAANPGADARAARAAAQTRDLLAARGAPTNDIDAPAEILRRSETGASLWDCAMCPEMVITPAGSYTIGSLDAEPGRARDEGPRKLITLAYALAVGRFEVTREEYEAFVAATGHPVSVGCLTDRMTHGVWEIDTVSTFRDPSMPQTGRHPVACVSWEDAQAYVAWLNTQTHGGYRLLTESEWEFLARAGSTTVYPWGDDVNIGCAFMNGTDATARATYADWSTATCDDGALKTSPVGVYQPNAFGLYDMIGNLADWVQDCYVASYEALASNGAAQESASCAARTNRGGSWGSQPPYLRTADRFRKAPGHRDDSIGIRVARTLN